MRSVILVMLALALATLSEEPGSAKDDVPAASMEVRGISLAHLHRRGFGYGSEECRKQLGTISEVGANWVALNNFAYMENVNQPAVRFGGDGSMGAKDITQCVQDAHAAGLKVLLKPHLWAREFWNGSKWHGDIAMTSEEDWEKWFENYGAYILYTAKIAADAKAEAVCIGVEYEGTSQQAGRWRKLIAAVRKIYTGHLTYAATFREYEKITWWDAVDCIGIDAYFPVAKSESAPEAELRAGWDEVYAALGTFSKKWSKPICFLELGYTQDTKAGKEPWSYAVKQADAEYQARLFKVAAEEERKHDFMRGLFVWKWFTSTDWQRMEGHDTFCVQDNGKVIDVLKGEWKAK
ncbi:MAG TPA: hypothetical protein VIL86_18390 [Tepidisphaeraceae bacterium]|jgi:hypothetical protein